MPRPKLVKPDSKNAEILLTITVGNEELEKLVVIHDYLNHAAFRDRHPGAILNLIMDALNSAHPRRVE